jgi:AcrR family transcriptional regulator
MDRALPQIGPEAHERADAARNRDRILCTAARLFEQRGAGCVSMDELAEAAGVGKGTIFRRFGSRAALAAAVLSEHERDFQEHIIRGCPPLGPGAPARERLIAFGEGLLDLLRSHAALIAAAEHGGARLVSAPYAVYRLHVTLLLREAEPQCDAELFADMLLAALSSELFVHLHEAREMPLERLKAGWRDLVGRALPAQREPVSSGGPPPAQVGAAPPADLSAAAPRQAVVR